KGRFKKLFAKKKPIRSYGGKFRFGYKQGGRTMRLKARTYTMKRGKKQYSNYSAIKELKI
ncbi:MAG: hypothetical protein J5988_03215, partial [Eubacterium sp.]|nr:hypothetical protein [Eubacterium sp.]